VVTLAAPRSDAAGTGVVPGTGASESVNEAAQTADRAQIPTAVTSIAAGNTMQAYVVSVPAYKAYLTPGELRLLYLYERMNFDYDYGPFGTNFSDAIVATPLRMPQHPKNSAFTADVAGGNTLRGSPSETLDGALASEPEFGLSGRNDSILGEPHDRFVSLRGSSALVLLDGLPFIDPFNGSVPWNEATSKALARVELVPDGGSSAWGNGALGGVVQLFTDPPAGVLVTKPGILFGGSPPDPTLTKQVVEGTWDMAAIFGEYDTRSFEFVATQPTSEGVMQVLGGTSSSDGFPLVYTPQRGPIDVAAWSRHEWLETRWRQPLGKNVVVTATIRGSEDSNGEGTLYQQDSSIGRFASVSVAGKSSSGFAWNAAAYLQGEGSTNAFSSVNSTRTIESPVIEQLAEPVTAYGVSLSGEWWQSDGSGTSAGLDFRSVRGETRDAYAFSGGEYTRGLVAGGDQEDFGVYLLRDQRLTSSSRLVLGVRVDKWDEAEGRQVQRDLSTGGVSSDDRFADEGGTEFSPSLGIVWRPTQYLRFHLNSQQAFSTPTLSELYQPYGEDAFLTEANPRLRIEHNSSFEAAGEYILQLPPIGRNQNPGPNPAGKPPVRGMLTLGVTVFSNELHNAIGNVTLSRDPSGFPIFGTVPEGYIGKQWINLDRSQVQGVTISAKWDPTASFSLNVAASFSDATIHSVAAAPDLDGKQISGVPRASGVVSGTWQVTKKIALTSRIRVLGSQFEDDENTSRLANAVVVDLRASYALSRHTELFVMAENLTDARIEVSRSADGLIYVGTPCIVLGGMRLSW
jgi:outer membrane receptor protein involved in Fe transport